MRRLSKGLVAASLVVAAGITVQGSSHREALAILNEPCADNTDTYAWVSNGSHDKLYLIMDFNPLHEPGQGNQGLRACNGYRYEFHIAKGASLEDQVGLPRRVHEHARSPKRRPSADRSARRRQRAALAAHRRHRDDEGHAHRRRRLDRRSDDDDDVRPRQESAGPAEQPRPADRSAGLRSRRLPGLRLRRSRPAAKSVSTIRRSSTRTSTRSSNGGRIIAGQFDDPYQLDEKGIFDLVNLNTNDLGGIPGARRPPGKDVFTGFNLFSIALEIPIERHLPARHPAQRRAQAQLDRQPAARVVEHQPPADADRRCQQHHHRPQGLRRLGAGRPQRPAALQRRPRRDAASDAATCTAARCNDVTNFGADILFPVLVRDAEALGIYTALGVPASDGGDAQRAPRWTSSTPSTWAGRFRSPTASRATSSRSTRRSIRAFPTAGASAAGPRRTAIR